MVNTCPPDRVPAAILRGIGRIDFDAGSPSFFRFGGQTIKELRPRRVTDAFGQAMGMNHAVHMQVFHADHSEAIHDLPTLLMDEVLTPEGNALMNPRYCLAMRAALLYQQGEGFLLLIERQTLSLPLVGGFAHLQQVVIEPTALRKRLVELTNLLLGRIDPVFIGFTHSNVIAQNRAGVKRNRSIPAPRQGTPIIPA